MLRKRACIVCSLLFFLMIISGTSFGSTGSINENDELWLTLVPPPPGKAPICEIHGKMNSTTEPSKAPGFLQSKDTSKRPKGSAQGRPHTRSDFESEHRPMPVRNYFIRGQVLSKNAEAYLLHPDGTHQEIDLKRGNQAKVSFSMPMNEDHRHGPNNVYVVDRKVIADELVIQTAKWITIHHSCRWGHDYRNNPAWLQSRSMNNIPLDIVIDDLWDQNFHVRTSSGDTLTIKTLFFGNPLQDVRLTLTTEKKWKLNSNSDSTGTARVQLIRDYYPSLWETFKRSKPGHLNLTAEYIDYKPGQYLGQPYSRVRYITTLPWRYTPSSKDYASYAYGLGIGFATLLISGFGIYLFRERRRKPYREIRFEK